MLKSNIFSKTFLCVMTVVGISSHAFAQASTADSVPGNEEKPVMAQGHDKKPMHHHSDKKRKHTKRVNTENHLDDPSPETK